MRENTENINRLKKDFRTSKWILSEHVFFIDVNFWDWISPFWYMCLCLRWKAIAKWNLRAATWYTVNLWHANCLPIPWQMMFHIVNLGNRISGNDVLFSHGTSNLAVGSEPTEPNISLSSAFIATLAWCLMLRSAGEIELKPLCIMYNVLRIFKCPHHPIQQNARSPTYGDDVDCNNNNAECLSSFMFRLLSKIAQPLIISYGMTCSTVPHSHSYICNIYPKEKSL